MKRILPIVEGEGDMKAVPELVRRIAIAKGHYALVVCTPQRRGDLPKVLQRFNDFYTTALLEDCPVLWVLDYDCEQCVDQSADIQKLQDRAFAMAPGKACAFAFMVQEFESLFLAGHETTRRVFSDIPPSVVFPADAEAVRDAKGWLSEARPKGSAYKPTQHQSKLASQVDLDRLRLRSPSYVRFEAAVEGLLSSQTVASE